MHVVNFGKRCPLFFHDIRLPMGVCGHVWGCVCVCGCGCVRVCAGRWVCLCGCVCGFVCLLVVLFCAGGCSCSFFLLVAVALALLLSVMAARTSFRWWCSLFFLNPLASIRLPSTWVVALCPFHLFAAQTQSNNWRKGVRGRAPTFFSFTTTNNRRQRQVCRRLRGTLTSFACWCVWALSFFSHCALTAGFARQVRSQWRKVGVSPKSPPPPKQQPASRTPRNCKYVLRRGRVGRKFELTQTTTSNVLTCGSHIEHTHRSQCTTYA